VVSRPFGRPGCVSFPEASRDRNISSLWDGYCERASLRAVGQYQITVSGPNGLRPVRIVRPLRETNPALKFRRVARAIDFSLGGSDQEVAR
jgi:hypothetical protein